MRFIVRLYISLPPSESLSASRRLQRSSLSQFIPVMPSAAHTLLLALHAAAFIALTSTSITSIHAVALPLPMPLPLLANDYSHNNLIATRAPPRRRKSTTKTMKNKHNETDIAHRPHAAVARVYPTTVDPMEPRQVDDRFASLNGYYTQADRHAKDLSRHLIFVRLHHINNPS